MTGLHVNFSTEEAASEGREFAPIPSGTYNANITDVALTDIVNQDSKNYGKQYWRLEFTMQGGDYDMRKVWTNCMLFEGALYTLAQLMKATGNEQALKTGEIPSGESLIGKNVDVVVQKKRNTYLEQREGSEEPIWTNEVKGIKTSQAPTKKAGKSGSLLP